MLGSDDASDEASDETSEQASEQGLLLLVCVCVSDSVCSSTETKALVRALRLAAHRKQSVYMCLKHPKRESKREIVLPLVRQMPVRVRVLASLGLTLG